MFRSLLILIIICTQAQAQLLTEKDHWSRTRLTFEEGFGGSLNRANCEFALGSFLGCIAAYNTALALIQQKPVALFPDPTSTEPLPGFKSITAPATYEKDLVSFFTERKKLFSLTPPLSFDQASFQLNTLLKQSGQEAFITGMAVNQYLRYAFDPHTHLTPRSFLEERGQSASVIKTLGIMYEPVKWKGEMKLIISHIYKTSAFYSLGVTLGSVIHKVNGVEDFDGMVKEMEKDRIEVTLENDDGMNKVIVERTEQSIPTVEAEIVTDAQGNKYGYLKLTTFNDEEACGELRRQGSTFMDENVKGIILDVRRNGGGKINTARCVLDMYLEQGSFNWIEQELQTGKMNQGRTRGDFRVFTDIHTVVLINGLSASAAEATALYLQAYRKAFVVGERSYGKGTAQRLQEFAANPSLLVALTTAKYMGPHFVSPQLQGVQPDIEAYPRFYQQEPTPYRREADTYPNAIVNAPVKVPEMPDRSVEVQKIADCLKENQERDKAIQKLNKYQKAVWDYQLSTAVETLACANGLKLPFFKGTNIPISN